jgi:hypothetical protein
MLEPVRAETCSDGSEIASLSWCQGPVTNFSFSLKFPLDSCVFVILLRPLWREGGSVIYYTNASGPCQSTLLGRSPAELTAVFYDWRPP